MKRWAFTVAAGVSLAFSIAAAVLWIRSFKHSDFVQIGSGRQRLVPTSPEQAVAIERLRESSNLEGMYTFRYIAIAFKDGIAFLFRAKEVEMVENGVSPPSRLRVGTNSEGILLVSNTSGLKTFAPIPGMASEERSWMGFSYLHFRISASSDTRRVGVPIWLPFIALCILPLMHVRRRAVSRRRTRMGLCPTCGYDLRATPDRCPECGAVPAKGAS